MAVFLSPYDCHYGVRVLLRSTTATRTTLPQAPCLSPPKAPPLFQANKIPQISSRECAATLLRQQKALLDFFGDLFDVALIRKLEILRIPSGKYDILIVS